jgi:hypothetical protein
VNVPSKQENFEEKIILCWRPEGHLRKEQDPDPDPYQNVTDPDTAFVNENLSVLVGQQCEQSFGLKRLYYMICILPISDTTLEPSLLSF